MRKIHLNELGDTIVEVLLATAVLSVVMAGAFTLTNRATRLIQSADERTQVSNLMQAQVELIRAKHSVSQDAFWRELASGNITSYESTNFCELRPNPSAAAFAVRVDDEGGLLFERVVTEDTTHEITNDSEELYNIWVEAVNGGAPISYTNFFVYSCWEGIGGEGLQRSGLILRLSR